MALNKPLRDVTLHTQDNQGKAVSATLGGEVRQPVEIGWRRKASSIRYSKYLPRERIRGRVVFCGSKAYEATATRGHRPLQLPL